MTTTTSSIAVIAPSSLSEAQQLSEVLAKASLLPSSLRAKPSDVLLTIMTGAELGLAPMQAIRLIHIIEGRPAMSADLIAGLCLSRRDVCESVTCIESTSTRATYEAKRKGSRPVTLSFTMEQAKAAGLTGKQNWQRYPDAMLRARCVAAVCRAVFPDLVGGLYDPEELAPDSAPPPMTPPNVIDSVVVQAPPAPAPSPKRRQLVVEAPTSLADRIAAAASTADLHALVADIRALPQAEREQLRPAYDARLKALAAEVTR